MALGLSDLQLILSLKSRGYLPPPLAVAEIGAQQLNASVLESRGDIEKLGRRFGIDAPPPKLVQGAPGYHSLVGAPYARLIWEWLSAEYIAIDVDGSPGTEAIDLNFDRIPAKLVGKFGLVTNFGSTEHIANQLNAFRTIHDLTAIDGLMIHNLPAARANHGFFSYNARYFYALSRANNYRNVLLEFREDSALAVLQKQHDLTFIVPLDVDDQSVTDNQILRRRYWSVFDKEAIDRIAYSKETKSGRARPPYLRGNSSWSAARPICRNAKRQFIRARNLSPGSHLFAVPLVTAIPCSGASSDGCGIERCCSLD